MSASPTILVLTNAYDEHVDHVVPLLAARGATVHRLDPADVPAACDVTMRLGAGLRAARLRTARGDLVLDGGTTIAGIWYRRPGKPQAPATLEQEDWKAFVATEAEVFMRDLYRCLPGPWFPAPPHVLKELNYRLFQLETAVALGFDVPETLVTTEPEALLAFYRRHEGRVVTKLISSTSHHKWMADAVIYADLVSMRELVHAESVRGCPCLFQQYVEKKTELRVTVVEDEVFAAEIHSQTANRTRVDWRRYDLKHTPHAAAQLPPAVLQRCAAIVRQLGLRYGAIDLVRTPDDRYVFLEVNPNGQYLWIEQETGLPITDAICRALLGRAGGLA